ncbi:UPF0415 protein C7orf25-like [Quillaja saponaria]|uniref:UPF0415 protein C7orf25-like n=1 Tax=Quillaja saponaria TaxID=32244 RepID=A0AAD7PVU5_QUISA|nr:UPF0415 protein C7orf25-like [Quillaja saponaria]
MGMKSTPSKLTLAATATRSRSVPFSIRANCSCSMDAGGESAEVELAKHRCRGVIDRVERLPASTKITDSCKRTLLRLANAELAFLSRCHSSFTFAPLSVNIGHLEAVVHILQQPFVTGVSRVCKSIPILPSVRTGVRINSSSKDVHVDIVCTLSRKPVWIIVSNRNPKYISWHRCQKSKGLKLRIEEALAAAQSTLTLRPSSIIVFFANGLGDHVCQKIQHEFGAFESGLEFSVFDFDSVEDSDGEWLHILGRSYQQARVLEIKLADVKDAFSNQECDGKCSCPGEAHLELVNLGDTFSSLILGMTFCSLNIANVESAESGNCLGEGNLVNFDTTALIALVSGISNGGTEKLLATPESELRQRFKGNYEFVIGQVMSEIKNPILVELGKILCGKSCIICESVHSEFKELVMMCGGPNEKLRADKLMTCLRIVPDSPSERMTGLPTTRKLALKNKVVFGTGDYWHAPTLTANMAFVRAVSQTGMSLFAIEHRPRALTGD